MVGFPEVFSNLLSVVVLLLAWLLVIVAFFVLSVQFFITILEFKLTTLAGFVLVPFAPRAERDERWCSGAGACRALLSI